MLNYTHTRTHTVALGIREVALALKDTRTNTVTHIPLLRASLRLIVLLTQTFISADIVCTCTCKHPSFGLLLFHQAECCSRWQISHSSICTAHLSLWGMCASVSLHVGFGVPTWLLQHLQALLAAKCNDGSTNRQCRCCPSGRQWSPKTCCSRTTLQAPLMPCRSGKMYSVCLLHVR